MPPLVCVIKGLGNRKDAFPQALVLL
jgi:hypothetical protein